VSDGKLTITSGSGAVDPKLCFVEVGPVGGTIDSAAQARLADLVEKATNATYQAQQAFTSRGYVFGSYVDELLSYTNNGTRYFTHSNNLYSPSAVTNAAGQVQERYRYDAYGKQTITTATGTTRNQSAVGFSRGFTGYILDDETGLYYARARMYSTDLGRFIGRDPFDYVDGYSLYYAYFAPGATDPFGLFSFDDYLTPGTFEISVPAGPVELVGTITVKKEGDCIVLEVGVGFSFSIKNRVIKYVKKIPYGIGDWASKKSDWMPDISVQVWGEGVFKKCCDCWEGCEFSLNGGITAGNGRRGGGSPNSGLSIGAVGEANGIMNVCAGTIRLDYTGVFSIGLNLKTDWFSIAYNKDFEDSGNLIDAGPWSALQWSKPCPK